MLSALSLALICAVGAGVGGVGPVAQAAERPKKILCDRKYPSGNRLYDFTFKDVLETKTIALNRFRGLRRAGGERGHLLRPDPLLPPTECTARRTFGRQAVQSARVPLQLSSGMYKRPGNRQEILNGIKYVRPGDNFTPKFPIFQKIEVNGEKAAPFLHFPEESLPLAKPGFLREGEALLLAPT
uniref:Putative glutathione peroxidase n=1 Tax=Ixodes ricinus TaxID=34613 RepID=V5GLW7_IXORI